MRRPLLWTSNGFGPISTLEAVLSAGTATSIAGAVDTTLRAFFESRAGLVDRVGGAYPEMTAALEEFVLRGGKRIRPSFAWTGWLGAGGDPDGSDADAVLRTCTALELVQACALIHDDIIDSSSTRRGFPTVHVQFTDLHAQRGWAGDSAQFGSSVAILLGDLALAWADDLIRESGLPADTAVRLGPVWSAMRTEVLGGQILDITDEASRAETVESALRIDRYKTAAYTVERPLHIGAVLAGADAALIDAYRRFGADIGVAFQLRDDLLGVFGDPAVTGKPSGDDLREGKRTVLLAVALECADAVAPDRAEVLRRGIGTDLSDADVDRMRTILTELGAVDDVERRITELTESGLAALESSDTEPAAKAPLRAMADAATKRTA